MGDMLATMPTCGVKPYYHDDAVTIYHSDCLIALQSLDDNSVDSIVTDPPYGLAFMGKKWDYDVPSVEVWAECLRVLKPGGHLLAFAGTRTQHRMACRIEDAGFEIRDMIAWVYGSGFPKSLDIGKAIDKMDAVEEKRAKQLRFTEWMRTACPIGSAKANELMGTAAEAGHYFTDGEQPHIATRPHFEALRPFFVCDVPAWVEGLVDVRTEESKNFAAREVVGKASQNLSADSTWVQHGGTGRFQEGLKEWDITAPATEAAKQWDGWGSALKPSFESITVATKPLDVAGYCTIMIANLSQMEQSCRQNASNAEKSSRHSQADLREVKINTARALAQTKTGECQANGTQTGKAGDTSSEAGTLESIPETERIALNTCLSWRHTLEGVLNAVKTSTTSTAFETITDWKTLSFCLSQITPDIIIKASCNPSGLSADAKRAMQFLNASFACCENTLTLSALAPAMSKEAETCQGAGVSPNLELCIMARKPLDGTIAGNVLKHGVGGINVDATRIKTNEVKTDEPYLYRGNNGNSLGAASERLRTNGGGTSSPQGRFPANLITDGSDEVVGLFPETDGDNRGKCNGARPGGFGGVGSASGGSEPCGMTYTDSGSAARFFYCAKSDASERRNSKHPTVKPIALMRYLVRLVTPIGATVLDPFMGSGTTIEAARLESCKSIGMEREVEYCADAVARLEQGVLF